MSANDPHKPERRPPVKGPLKRYAQLLLGIVLVLVFMFYVGPLLDRSAMLRPLAQFIDERGIDANMYFYTEVEEFSEASINMDNTRMYTPRGSSVRGN